MIASHRILLVDDDLPFRRTLEVRLTREGFDVRPAADGVEAMSVIGAGFEPDLVISDIVMPRMEGLEFLMLLRKRRRELPVIAISGGGRVEPGTYLETAAKLGAVATFEKPFGQAELVEAVRRCLATVAAAASAAASA